MANFYPPGFEQNKPIIAVDFDGVIHNAHSGWGNGTCYGNPIDGSIDSIKQLSTKYDIILFTAKVKKNRPLVDGKTGLDLVKEWLKHHNILHLIKEITCEKPIAELYIDDNGYRFNNWKDTLIFIKNIL